MQILSGACLFCSYRIKSDGRFVVVFTNDHSLVDYDFLIKRTILPNSLTDKTLRRAKLEIFSELLPIVIFGGDFRNFNPAIQKFKRRSDALNYFSRLKPTEVGLFLIEFPLLSIMLPEILTLVKNPLVSYSKCKPELFSIIRSMFEASNRSVLLTLLNLVISLKFAAEVNLNEEEELKDESSKIEAIICAVFSFSSFDDPLNVMAVILPTYPSLGTATLKHSYAANIFQDDEFLGICLKHNVTTPFGCGAVLDRVSSLFWGFAYCEDYSKLAGAIIHDDSESAAANDSNLRTYVSMMFSRSSPVQMLILEGLSKCLILSLAASLSLLYSYGDLSTAFGLIYLYAFPVVYPLAVAYEVRAVFSSPCYYDLFHIF